MAQINKPTDYFNTKLYSGSASSQSITGVGFQPDLIIVKNRTITGNHYTNDIIRGASQKISTNSTSAEFTQDGISSFDSDGFTVGTASTDTNNSGNNYVSWNWLASNTTASNTDGSITSTVSANTTAGFSIVSYTGNGSAGATIGHGLGVSPSWIVTKKRSATGSWVVYHKSQGATKFGIMDTTASFGTSSSLWNNTEPTSSVFSVGTDADTNGSGSTFIAYCFAEKKGFSKFGSYTGNGSTDGAFIYTGFKPAFIMCKRTDSTGVWFMCDNKRVGFNGRPNNTATVGNPELSANDSRSEAAGNTNVMDIFSNGFKLIQSGAEINGSGASFIYMAFAKNPLVGTNNIPATAR